MPAPKPVVRATEIGAFIRHHSGERRFMHDHDNRLLARHVPFVYTLSSPVSSVPAKAVHPHRPVTLIHLILLALLLCLAPPTGAAPRVPLPMQPFTVELLDLARGQWRFDDALGQRLSLDGPVTGFAFPQRAGNRLSVAYLCCDPEFPGDPAHAVMRTARADGEGPWRIEEPYLAASVQLSREREGVVRCTLTSVRLGPATTGDRYVAALYVVAGGRPYPVWLSANGATDRLALRLLTDRVGHVFAGDEPARVTLVAWWDGGPGERRFTLRATDLATGRVQRLGTVLLRRSTGLTRATVTLPLRRFGVFAVQAVEAGRAAGTLRVTRVPRPRALPPARSRIGINVFQQQVWWYAFQVPLMAQAGVHWIRPWLAWENTWAVQQPEAGAWDTRALDAALRRLRAHGMAYQLILWGAPAWAASGSEWPPVTDLPAWSAYVEALVTRYRGRIRCYEVWNEPDGMWPAATRDSGEHYFGLLKATYAAARRADPDCMVLGLSHAGVPDWLARMSAMGATKYLDAVTLHTYQHPREFRADLAGRIAVLKQGGLGDKPVWVNEFGATAYDFNAAYSAAYGCSERSQAADLPALYAESLALHPQARAFWFCTYDPRDAAHPSQWTGDAGIGVLYLGFLPKLSYAALAGVAQAVDGRRCLGRAEVVVGVRQVSFSGPVAVVWRDGTSAGAPLPATRLGCRPGERIVVRDLFGNLAAAGTAARIAVDLAHGPVYVEGSRQMAAIAACESAVQMGADAVVLAAGGSGVLPVSVPAGVRVSAAGSAGLPVRVEARSGNVRLTAVPGTARATGAVRLRVSFPAGSHGLAAPHTLERVVPVTVGAPNLLRDGGFERGDLGAWGPERVSPFTWDPNAGHDAPGAMRLDGPFDRRMVHWNISPDRTRSMRFRGWVKTRALAGCRVTMEIAAFGSERWLGNVVLAASAPTVNGAWAAAVHPGRLPTGTMGWTLVETEIPADTLPAGTTRLAFFLDVKGGAGTLWLDDVDLWQPEP